MVDGLSGNVKSSVQLYKRTSDESWKHTMVQDAEEFCNCSQQ